MSPGEPQKPDRGATFFPPPKIQHHIGLNCWFGNYWHRCYSLISTRKDWIPTGSVIPNFFLRFMIYRLITSISLFSSSISGTWLVGGNLEWKNRIDSWKLCRVPITMDTFHEQHCWALHGIHDNCWLEYCRSFAVCHCEKQGEGLRYLFRWIFI